MNKHIFISSAGLIHYQVPGQLETDCCTPATIDIQFSGLYSGSWTQDLPIDIININCQSSFNPFQKPPVFDPRLNSKELIPWGNTKPKNGLAS